MLLKNFILFFCVSLFSMIFAFTFLLLNTEVQIGNKIEEGTFHANHPFVFYIEDETTGTILYIGKIQNPLNTSGTTGKVQQEFPSRFNPDTAIVTPNSGKLP